mmetsp:Transcript_81930/g.235404  ORF Transcript_81930/g.235404 Transcript_81930/m.235404 type:complete len:273 (+) Transcript_81930:146-964(+)
MGFSDKELALKSKRLVRSTKVVLDLSLTVVATCLGVALLYGVAFSAQADIIDAAQLTSFLAKACPFVTMVAFIAPAPIVANAMHTLDSTRLAPNAYRAQAACNVLGIAYGIQKSNGMWLGFAVKLSVCLNSSLVLCSLHMPIDTLGYGITALNIFMYVTPLGNMKKLLKFRDASRISVGLTCLSVVNNALWTLYALMMEDLVLLLPSVLGYILSAFQVLIILWCRGSLPFDLAFLLLLCSENHCWEGTVVLPVAQVEKKRGHDEDCEMPIAG